jgi:tRNA pseudouridine55 synthase
VTSASVRRPSTESGLVLVDKPAGMTSHDVVARVRRIARTRKVGHAGTLDPMATGVLVLGVNRATRLLGHLALTEKAYQAEVRLGVSTTTDDAEGELVDAAAAADVAGLAEDQVRDAFAELVGDIMQVPSSVSAVKVDGERAYRRVRAGEDVQLAARPVTVHDIGVGGLRHHDGVLDVTVSVRCSSGTYIRAIARDVGAALGVGGHLTALRRTGVGPVGIGDTVPLATLEEAGQVSMMPMGTVARRFFACVDVDTETARAVGFGRSLDLRLPVQGPAAVLGPDGELLALYEHRADDPDGPARPVAVFV